MSLKERIPNDIHRVFLNQDHFGTKHTWNGVEVECVIDDDQLIKRKNNNVVDNSWGENNGEKLVFIAAHYFRDGLIRKPEPNQLIYFDGRQYRISQIIDAVEMYDITIRIPEARTL